MRTQIGVISDTHGLLRPEAIDALGKSDLIFHAGDIGKPEILEALSQIAPVIAIRGNHDTGAWAEAIAERETVTIDSVSIHLIHIVQELNLQPNQAQVVISGHSHKPSIEHRDGILFLNPGSAGRRRFRLPVSVAQLEIEDSVAEAKIIELSV